MVLEAREAKQLLFIGWAFFFCPWVTRVLYAAPFTFRAQLEDSVRSVSFSALAKITHSVKRERGGECLAHMGKIFPVLLALADHDNSPQLSGTLYCREKAQNLGCCWTWSTCPPFLCHDSFAEEYTVQQNALTHRTWNCTPWCICFFSRWMASWLHSIWMWRNPVKGLAQPKHL